MDADLTRTEPDSALDDGCASVRAVPLRLLLDTVLSAIGLFGVQDPSCC